MERTPGEMASRYLLDEWKKTRGNSGSTPPLDLQQAVVLSVNQLGYTKRLVDSLLISYIKKNSRVSGGSDEDQINPTGR